MLLIGSQVLAISLSLLASGGILVLSAFDIPELRSQPAARSLPSIRWLFSRGSHTFPQAAVLSSAAFAGLAYHAYQATSPSTISKLVSGSNPTTVVAGYVLAAALSFSIAPWTALVMIPTNFKLIELNEKYGGSRSAKSAAQSTQKAGSRSAEDSVNGKGQPNQFTDLSGPQEKTTADVSAADEAKVQTLLQKFAWLNLVRAVLTGAGGVVGLITVLSSKSL